MSDRIDPYRKWLEISPEKLPPDHYVLLGLKPFESNADTISAAAKRAADAVRDKATDAEAADAARLLKEIAQAHRCLTHARRKAAYDRSLQQKAGRGLSAERAPPPLPKPRMLDLPPFTPPSPPLQSGAPPVAGEPAPPPVMGEPVRDPPPALHPSKMSNDLPNPPPRPPAPEPRTTHVVNVSAKRRKSPTIGPPPVPGQPVDSPAPVPGRPVDLPPPVPGRPVDSTTPLPGQPVDAPPDEPPAVADRQCEPSDAPSPASAPPTPRGWEQSDDAPQARRRSTPLPRQKTERASTPAAVASAAGAASQTAPGELATVTPADVPPPDETRGPGLRSAGPAEPDPRPQTLGDGKPKGRVGTVERPDERERLPWPILVPSAAAILILIVGAAVLLGGFGSGGRRDARQGQPDGDPTANSPTEETVDVALLRDDEGSTAKTPATTDAPSDGEGTEVEPAEDAAAEPGTETGGETPATAASDATGVSGAANAAAADAEGTAAAATETEHSPPESEPAAPTPPPATPDPPGANPFRSLPQQIDLAAATEQALAAAKEHPLDPDAGRIRIGTIDLAGDPAISLKLLGGGPALPGAGEFALKREFSLDDPNRWWVDLVEGTDAPLPLGSFALTGNDLSFRWTPNHDVAAAEYLQNCVLQFDSDQFHHVLGLRRSLPAPPVLLQLHLNDFQESIPIPALPDPEVVRLEVVRLTGTRQATNLPPDASARPGKFVPIYLLDSHRNTPAAIRVICEDARAGRVRFRVTPMGKTAGHAWATMGIQSATSEINRLRREKDGLTARLKGIDQQIAFVGGQNRDLVRALGESKKPIVTRMRAIDQRVGQLNAVVARLKPLHQTAGIQFRVLAMMDGQDVVLAGPPVGK